MKKEKMIKYFWTKLSLHKKNRPRVEYMGFLGETQMQPSSHPQSKQQNVKYDLSPKGPFSFIYSFLPTCDMFWVFSPQKTLLHVLSNIS